MAQAAHTELLNSMNTASRAVTPPTLKRPPSSSKMAINECFSSMDQPAIGIRRFLASLARAEDPVVCKYPIEPVPPRRRPSTVPIGHRGDRTGPALPHRRPGVCWSQTADAMRRPGSKGPTRTSARPPVASCPAASAAGNDAITLLLGSSTSTCHRDAHGTRQRPPPGLRSRSPQPDGRPALDARARSDSAPRTP